MSISDDFRRGVHKPLPEKKQGYTQKATIDGQLLYFRTGEYMDGSLAEISIDIPSEKKGGLSDIVRGLLNNIAIGVSIGLQHGTPLEEYVRAYVGTKFPPNGIVEGHEKINEATSILDFIFRDLALSYGLEHVLNELDQTADPISILRKAVDNPIEFLPVIIQGGKTGPEA